MSGGSPLLRNAGALILSTLSTSLLGVAFWGLAARLYTPSSIGHAAAEVAAMTLLANVAQLNLVSVFVKFLPRAGSYAGRMVRLGYLVCLATSVLAVVIFLTTSLSNDLVPTTWRGQLVFAVAVPLWTIFVVQDSVLTGLRKAAWVPVENASFSAAKLVLLVALSTALPDTGIFLSWSLPVLVAVGGVSLLLVRRAIPHHVRDSRGLREFPARRELGSFVAAEYANSLVLSASTLLLPLLVVAELGSTSAGYFYLPYTVGTSVALLLTNIAASFVVEGSRQPEHVAQLFRGAARAAGAIVGIAVVVVVVGAPVLLRILGPGYATRGTTLLRLLAVALPFTTVVVGYSALRWLAARVWGLAAMQLAGAIITVTVAALLLPHLGIVAVGWAVLGTQALLAACVTPALVRGYLQHARSAEHRAIEAQPAVVMDDVATASASATIT